jgi:uncharacterized membrane protein YgcG
MQKRWFASLLGGLVVLLMPAFASADLNDFTVTNFTADYYLSTADPQGQLTVKERLDVDFTDYNHGILRAIPEKYNGQAQHIHILSVQRDGEREKYTTYASNDNEVLKIGNPNATITGTHTYQIEYTAQNVIRFGADRDQLIWNTNGTQWTQPFSAETATLHLAENVKAPLGSLTCFTGTLGSHDQDCTVDGQGRTVTFTTTRPLNAGETMTFSADFPPGVFHKPTAADWWRDHIATILWVLLPAAIASAIAYPYWRKNGKDIKGRGTIVPEYGPPDGVRAAEAEVLLNYKLGGKGVSATIIDLAIRKYLRLIESTEKNALGLGSHKTYTLERLPVPANDALKPYEQQILDGLFPQGDTTKLSDLKNKFYVTRGKVLKAVPQALTLQGYFTKNPRKVGGWLHIVGALLFIIGFSLGGPSLASRGGIVLAGLVFLGFGLLMPKRSQKGTDAKDALEGLKLYMDVAEKDRLAMLQSPNAPYANRSDAPTQTVELFEKLLPFAMVMGVEQNWAKQFEGIYTSPPDWYQGNWTAFNAGYLVGSLNDSVGAMNASFASPSSGSGGGGFSGGGGGGGGGGGW